MSKALALAAGGCNLVEISPTTGTVQAQTFGGDAASTSLANTTDSIVYSASALTLPATTDILPTNDSDSDIGATGTRWQGAFIDKITTEEIEDTLGSLVFDSIHGTAATMSFDNSGAGNLTSSFGGDDGTDDPTNFFGTVTVGSGSNPHDLVVHGVATFNQDIIVLGTVSARNEENVNISDSNIWLNQDYTTAVGVTGGIAVNYLPTATTDTAAAGGFASTPTVNTVGGTTFAAGASVQVSGADNEANNGPVQVVTHAANVMTISGTPDHDFCKSAFEVDTGDTGAAFTQVNVSLIETDTGGDWRVGKGSTAAAITSSLTTLSTGNGRRAVTRSTSRSRTVRCWSPRRAATTSRSTTAPTTSCRPTMLGAQSTWVRLVLSVSTSRVRSRHRPTRPSTSERRSRPSVATSTS
jgi:hypothetical protein